MNKALKAKNWPVLYKFNKCCRYIDDLLTINNDGLMDKLKNEIYPPELKLNCEDKTNQEVTFLDLNLKIIGKNLHYSLYDKRDNFNFKKRQLPKSSWHYSN